MTAQARTMARLTDPETSHIAADGMVTSGKAATHREYVLSVVNWLPGQTAGEYSVLSHLERHEWSRRLPELRAKGQIENGERRHCRVLGSLQMTWWPVEQPND